MLITSGFVSNRTLCTYKHYEPCITTATTRGFLDVIIKPILDGIVKVVVNPFLAAVKPILQTFMKFITDALAWLFPEVPVSVQGLVKIVSKIAELGVTLFTTIVAVVEAVVTLALSLPGMIVDSATEFGLAVAESFHTMAMDIKDAYEDVGAKCKDIARTVKSLDQVPDTFRNYNIESAFTGLVSTVWTIVKSVAMFPLKIFTAICRQFGQTNEKVESDLTLSTDNMINGVQDKVTKENDTTTTAFANAYENTRTSVTNQLAQKKNVVDKATNLISTTVETSTSLVSTFTTTVKTVVLSAISVFGTIFKQAFETIMNLGSGIIQAGKNLISFSNSWVFTILTTVMVTAGCGYLLRYLYVSLR